MFATIFGSAHIFKFVMVSDDYQKTGKNSNIIKIWKKLMVKYFYYYTNILGCFKTCIIQKITFGKSRKSSECFQGFHNKTGFYNSRYTQ